MVFPILLHSLIIILVILSLMKDRTKLQPLFTSFCNEISTQFGCSIQILRSDNVKKNCSHAFRAFLSSRGIVHQFSWGIVHQFSCPYIP